MSALSDDMGPFSGLVNWKERDEAKDGKETTTTLVAVNEMVLRELNQAIDCAMGDLVRLVERYDRLSLIGSCLAQVRMGIKVLEDMKQRTLGKDKLEKAKESLDYMKRKLELLSKVEDAKKGVRDRKNRESRVQS
jgi:hypothetical protein